ncbi:hypothetical protein [Methylovulum sp.]|uniref:hypothetical protein n=1 Tax=Methylovulum sp. TaxID=1916980 RepID=UPI00260FD92F|nr:hypothetical protein [Methylovulum sp.]MDD5125535.1 hypothetical protein [Methylovulum sp.]
MNNNFTHTISAVFIFLCLIYNNISLAVEDESAYFHFRRKPEKDYSFELYVRYKPIQLASNTGIELNLVYENKTNKDNELVLDEDYCSINVFNNGAMVQPRKTPKGHIKFMTEGINPGDGEIVEKGKLKNVKLNIDKIIDKAKKTSSSDSRDVLIDITPFKYGIKISCIGMIFSGIQPKIERIPLSVETDVFYITYKKSE